MEHSQENQDVAMNMHNGADEIASHEIASHVPYEHTDDTLEDLPTLFFNVILENLDVPPSDTVVEIVINSDPNGWQSFARSQQMQFKGVELGEEDMEAESVEQNIYWQEIEVKMKQLDEYLNLA